MSTGIFFISYLWFNIHFVLLFIVYILKTLGVHNQFYQRLVELIDSYAINTAAMGFAQDWQANFARVLNLKLGFDYAQASGNFFDGAYGGRQN